MAFTTEEAEAVQLMLEDLVRSLRHVPGGGKVEEGYWSFIYHQVRCAPVAGWSNLPMRDYCYDGLGVEMKLLQHRSPHSLPRRRIMHPAATRAIAFDPTQDAETCKAQVLNQFGAQIDLFRMRVATTSRVTDKADIRWGIFLWSPNLEEFLYFEKPMEEPDPVRYTARFVEGSHRGKPTRNLHIFEKNSGVKRFSVTMPEKGAKVQPYFDVPPIGQGAYAFKVPDDGRRAVWLLDETVRALQEATQSRDVDGFLMELMKRGAGNAQGTK